MSKRMPQKEKKNSILLEIQAGIVNSIYGVGLTLAMSLIIFSGHFAGYSSLGIKAGLICSSVASLLLFFSKRLKFDTFFLQDIPIILLSTMGATIAVELLAAGKQQAIFPTYLAAILLTMFLSGTVFILMGKYKMAFIIRYLPQPLVGGFLASTGWLLFKLGLLLNIESFGWHIFADNQQFISLLSILSFLALYYFIDFVFKTPTTISTTIAVSFVAFYGIIGVLGISKAELLEKKMVLSVPEITDGNMIDWSLLGSVDIDTLFHMLLPILGIILLSVVSSLLNSMAYETASLKDSDFNKELIFGGAVSLISIPLGGLGITYRNLVGSLIYHRFGVSTVIPNAIVCFSYLTILFFPKILTAIPSFILSGIICLCGLQFLVTWLIKQYRLMKREDYLLILMMFLISVTLGIAKAFFIGMFFAVILFLINYTKLKVVGSSSKASDLRIHGKYRPSIMDILYQEGEHHVVIKLQGYLFFGNFSSIFEEFKKHHPEKKNVKRVTFDFSKVSGLDHTSMYGFTKMQNICNHRHIQLCFSALKKEFQELIFRQIVYNESNLNIKVFNNLDDALQDYEREVLDRLHINFREPVSINQIARDIFKDEKESELFVSHLEEKLCEKDSVLCRKNDVGDRAYFVTEGEFAVTLESKGTYIILDKAMPGCVIGEMSLYYNNVRSATIIASVDSKVYGLSLDALNYFDKEHPALAAHLHRYLARQAMIKIVQSNRIISALG